MSNQDPGPYKVSLILASLIISLIAGSWASLYPESRSEFNTEAEPTSLSVPNDGRSCPGCVSGQCDPITSISGLPIVQLIVATAVGFIWAAVFIWLYANFYEGGGGGGGGGGGYGYGPPPAPQYGQPVPTYNAPAAPVYRPPAPVYKGPSRTSYYSGRALPSSLTDLVLEGLKYAAAKYGGD